MARSSAPPVAAEPTEHPALAALRTAPVDDEPETEAEREAVAEARRDIAAGRVYSDAQLRARLGLEP